MPEPEDKLSILLEEMRSNFRAVTEGHGSLTEKVDGLANGQVALVDKVDALALDVGVLKGDVRRIKDHLGLNGAKPRRVRRSKRRT